MFHVGQHVECIHDPVSCGVSDWWPQADVQFLRKGAVYVVAGIYQPRSATCAAPQYLQLVGQPTKNEYDSRAFRPLSSTRLDVFRQLLVSPKERVGA